MQQVYLGLHASSVRSVHNLCCGSPRYGCGCGCGLWRVWVLMAARRKQSGNNSNSKSNCKSHASKYSAVAVAVYSGKQAKQLRQERQQTVCVLWQLQKGRRLLRPHWHPAQAAAADRAGKRAMRNAQRATCSWQWPPLWHKPNKWKLFKVCFGLWPPWCGSVAANANCNGMSTHRDADAGHLRGLHATLPAVNYKRARREVALFLANFSQAKVNSLANCKST